MHFRAWLALICVGVPSIVAAQDTPGNVGVLPALKAEKSTDQTAGAAVTGEKLSDPSEIIRALRNGRTHVIVTLAPPSMQQRTDFASKASIGALRMEIKKLQKTVVDDLPAGEVTSEFQFDNIA